MNLQQLTSLVSNLTQQFQQTLNLAKRIEELPVQETLVSTSKIHVSNAGVSQSLEVKKIIEEASSLSFNRLLSVGDFILIGNILTVPELAQWLIENVIYSNAAAVDFNIPFSLTDKIRRDVVYGNNQGQILRQTGLEIIDEGIDPPKPAIPPNTVEITSFTVTDSVIGLPDIPIIGVDAITKLSQGWLLRNFSGDNLRLSAYNASNCYELTGESLSLDGILTTGFQNQFEWDGQEIVIFRNSPNSMTLKQGVDDFLLMPFVFADGIDFIMEPYSIAKFKRKENKIYLISYNVNNKKSIFINVKDFGALGLNVGDDTESIQKALDSAGEFGGRVYVPAGNYRTTGNMTIPKGVTIFGDGGNYSFDYINNTWTNQGSIIFCSSLTNDCFISNVAGVSFDTIAIVNNAVSSPTAGKGINLLNAGFISMNNVSIVGFYDNMHLLNSGSSSIMGCHFFNPMNYNLFMANPVVPDAGDNAIANCHFSSNTYDHVTNIRWESGGGLKLTNNKFNPGGGGRPRYHIDIEVKGNTSTLLLTNNSLEGFVRRAINITSDGTHIFDKIVINGNQMESFSPDPTCIEIQGNGQKIRSVDIVNNRMIRTEDQLDLPAIIINDILQFNESNNGRRGFTTKDQITNTPYVTNFDGRGGIVKGQLGIGNDFTFHGYRGFSPMGVGIGANTSGLLIKTDLESADSENVNLIITGSTASDNLPAETHMQVSNIGNGTIAGAVMLNKGFPFSVAKAFYLEDKLCFWVKPDVQYSSYNFEIQSTSKEIIIVDRILGGLPAGRTGEVNLKNYTTALTNQVITEIKIVSDLTVDLEVPNLQNYYALTGIGAMAKLPTILDNVGKTLRIVNKSGTNQTLRSNDGTSNDLWVEGSEANEFIMDDKFDSDVFNDGINWVAK